MDFQKTEAEINGTVFHVQELSARQRKEVYAMYKAEADPVDVQAKTIKMVCDECKEMSLDEILDMPGSVFGKLSEVIMDVSGLSEAAEAEAEKNS